MSDPPDPTQDLYELMDKAGLFPSNMMKPQPMTKIITEIRTKLATLTAEYIRQRENNHKENSNG